MTDSTERSAKRLARDEKKQAYLRALFERHAERLRAAGGGDAPSVARDVHAAMDDVLDRDRKISTTSGDIRCRRGCDHCCRGPVEIWPQEAALLVAVVRAAGVELDSARLERQSRYTVDAWREQTPAEAACVFLADDGACKVYENRPNACRKLLVMSDPGLCDAAKHPPGSTERWFSWEAEMLEAAALETFGRALMPVALLDALGRNG